MHFIHAADLHLGRPLSGLVSLPSSWQEEVASAAYIATQRMVDSALEGAVDAVFLAGDIYDNQNRSIQAQYFFYQEMKRLEEESIPVLISYGNHDYVMEDPKHIALPSNCHVFSSDVDTFCFETRQKHRVAVSGFSYDRRWVRERKILDFPEKKQDVDYHLGIMHGQVTSEFEENDYAPFSPSELDRLGYDYVALGHVHSFQQVSELVPAYYSGTISGRNKKETGPKGYLDVNLTRQAVDVTPISVSPLIWQEVSVSIECDQSWQDIMEEVVSSIRCLSYEAEYLFVEVRLFLSDLVDGQTRSVVEGDDFLRLLQHELVDEHIWPYCVTVDHALQDELKELQVLFPNEFNQQGQRLCQDDQVSQVVEDLKKDSRINYFIGNLDQRAKTIVEEWNRRRGG